MILPSVITLSDVTGQPKVRKDLPGPLRLGDKLSLTFKLRRRNGARTEELVIDGDYRITALSYDASGTYPKQHVSVETTSPNQDAWRSVKNEPVLRRSLPPARFPRTQVV